MGCQIETVVEGRKLYLRGPYNPYLAQEARKAGGKWDKERKAWAFHVDQGRELVDELFGSSEDCVLVQVAKDKPTQEGWFENSTDGVLSLRGYILVYRAGRDDRAQLFADLVQGTVPGRGGSVKHPSVDPSDDAVFELEVRRDFAVRYGLTVVPQEVLPEAEASVGGSPLPSAKVAPDWSAALTILADIVNGAGRPAPTSAFDTTTCEVPTALLVKAKGVLESFRGHEIASGSVAIQQACERLF